MEKKFGSNGIGIANWHKVIKLIILSAWICSAWPEPLIWSRHSPNVNADYSYVQSTVLYYWDWIANAHLKKGSRRSAPNLIYKQGQEERRLPKERVVDWYQLASEWGWTGPRPNKGGVALCVCWHQPPLSNPTCFPSFLSLRHTPAITIQWGYNYKTFLWQEGRV